MKEKVVFYSVTGHTLGVARRLSEGLMIVNEEIKAYLDDKKQKVISMIESPALSGYKRIYLGSPVHGFMMPVAVKTYLNSFNTFEGIEFVLFVTHFFPFAFLGGNQTLNQMKKLITSKGGKVISMTSFNWKSSHREKSIMDFINREKHRG